MTICIKIIQDTGQQIWGFCPTLYQLNQNLWGRAWKAAHLNSSSNNSMYIQAWGEKKGQKERGDASPYDLAILLESFWLESILAE